MENDEIWISKKQTAVNEDGVEAMSWSQDRYGKARNEQ